MAYGHSIQHTVHPTTPTAPRASWRPVIHFTDGKSRRFAGGLSHEDALKEAERRSKDLDDVEFFGAQRDRLQAIPAANVSNQLLIRR